MKYLILLLVIILACTETEQSRQSKPVLLAVEYTDNQCDTLFYPTLANETLILKDGVITTTKGYIVEHEVKSFKRLEYNPNDY